MRGDGDGVIIMVNILGFNKNNHRKGLTIRVWCYTVMYRFKIFFIPMKYLQPYFGCEGEESQRQLTLEQYRYAKLISMYVNRSATHTIWESKCLVRALTAQKLLKKQGISNTLYLGVGKDDEKMVAHAWIRCGECFVTGGNGEGYAVVAKYSS